MTRAMTLAPDAYLVLVFSVLACVATGCMSLLTLMNPPLYSSLFSPLSGYLRMI